MYRKKANKKMLMNLFQTVFSSCINFYICKGMRKPPSKDVQAILLERVSERSAKVPSPG